MPGSNLAKTEGLESPQNLLFCHSGTILLVSGVCSIRPSFWLFTYLTLFSLQPEIMVFLFLEDQRLPARCLREGEWDQPFNCRSMRVVLCSLFVNHTIHLFVVGSDDLLAGSASSTENVNGWFRSSIPWVEQAASP